MTMLTAFAAFLSLQWACLAQAQTVEAPHAQAGQGSSVNVGTGGTGSAGSVSGDVSRPGGSAAGLKGSIGDYSSAPDLKTGAMGPAGKAVAVPDAALGVPDLGTPSPGSELPAGRVEAPGGSPLVERVRAAGSAAVPGRNPGSPAAVPADAAAGLKSALPGTAGLEETLVEIQKGRKEGGASGDAVIGASLDKIFENARRAAKSAVDNADVPSVMGAMLRLEHRIRRTIGVANTSSPHDAPGLYESAIKLAKDSLASPAAEAVRQSVLSSAEGKARTSLPGLANEALAQAASGSEKGMLRSLRSLDRWESLLGAPGRPFITNLSRLKSFVQGVFSSGSSGAKAEGRAAVPPPSAGNPALPATAERTQAGRGLDAARAAANRIWFSENAGGRSVQAVLPGSAVPQVPPLATQFALSFAAASLGVEDDAAALYLGRGGAVGFGAVYRTLRGAGVGRTRSLLAAGSYRVKSFLAGAYTAFKLMTRRAPGPDEAARLAAREASDYRAAKALLSRGPGSLGLGAAGELIRRAADMAAAYEKLSADAGGIGAVRGVAARFEAAAKGLSPDEVLPPAAESHLTAGDGHGLAYWVERIHEATVAKAASLGASPASWAGRDPLAGLSPSAYDEKEAAVRGALERLLGDVEVRGGPAARTASVVAGLDPSPSRYTDLGRVGSLLAQGLKLRLKDGRPLSVTLLRDLESGRIAFARAELGPGKVLGAKEFAALTGLE